MLGPEQFKTYGADRQAYSSLAARLSTAEKIKISGLLAHLEIELWMLPA